MAYTPPKTDNEAGDGLDYVHLNKIEENIAVLSGGGTVATTTSEATANAIVKRDANGRAKVAAPSAEDDIALKSNVTAEATARDAAILVETNARIDDINAEEYERIAADVSLQASISTKNTTGGIGSHAFLKNISGMTNYPGIEYNGASLKYSDTGGASGESPTGIWKCMGQAGNGAATLYVRTS